MLSTLAPLIRAFGPLQFEALLEEEVLPAIRECLVLRCELESMRHALA